MAERTSVDTAISIILDHAPVLGTTSIATRRALGRRLAEPACATIDVPRFACSAMDGFAVASAGTTSASAATPVDLAIGDPIQAGSDGATLRPMTASPIATGAPMPARADAVVTRERAIIAGATLRVSEPILSLTNVRSVGEDMQSGRPILGGGAVVTADAIGALVGSGVDRVRVHRRPRMLLFSTGNELAACGADLAGAASIIDSNTPMIEAFAYGLGVECRKLGMARDTTGSVDAMLQRVMASSGEDLVVSTGGVSVGTFDLVRARIQAAGGKIHFHGLQMRPGKPLLFATLPDGRPYFGLPGNPVAALVGMRFFVLAAIRSMAGLAPELGQPVGGDQPGRAGTTEFLRGRAVIDGDAIVRVDTDLDQRSHVLSTVIAADTWLRVDQVAAGRTTRLAYSKVPTAV